MSRVYLGPQRLPFELVCPLCDSPKVETEARKGRIDFGPPNVHTAICVACGCEGMLQREGDGVRWDALERKAAAK